MRRLTIYTTDKEYKHFLELARNLHYVKKIETDESSSTTETFDNIKQGFEEMQKIETGTVKTTSLNDFLNEL